MKYLSNPFQLKNSCFVFLREAPDVPTAAVAVPASAPSPEAVASELVQRMPGADFSRAVSRLPGAEGITPMVRQLEATLESNGNPLADLQSTLENFANTDLGANGANLFTMLTSLLEDLGIDLNDSDKGNTTRGSNTGGRTPSGAPNSTGPVEPPTNVEMPELNDPISPEDMALLRERARDADVENLTTPAKNIAIATLRAYPNLTITSGYRGPERNAAAGGDVGSDHLTGNALDFGTTDASIEQWLNRQFPGQLWTDIHGSGGSGPANHLHVSYRPGGNRFA